MSFDVHVLNTPLHSFFILSCVVLGLMFRMKLIQDFRLANSHMFSLIDKQVLASDLVHEENMNNLMRLDSHVAIKFDSSKLLG